MTVKELRKLLEGYDDNMEVVVDGGFGWSSIENVYPISPEPKLFLCDLQSKLLLKGRV